MKKLVLLLSLSALTSVAGELILPATALERDRPVTLIYRTNPQTTGTGTLHVQWTDALGRTVEDKNVPVTLTDENEFRFPLDLRRALAMQNKLAVHFSLEGHNMKGERDHREEDASAEFVAIPDRDPWRDYQVIMWQPGSAEHFRALQKAGVNAGRSNESSTVLPEALLRDNLRWFVENIATDYYSEYHRYRKDRPYGWSWMQAKELYKSDPTSKEGLKRHPSFSDPAWIEKIHDRIVATTRTYAPYRPLYYNLADETGIAQLASFWDFDFSDHSLDRMRAWLKDRYGTLAALNRQWGSSFTTWNLVTPDTTREAMRRADENYSSWSDFKEWMDIEFARALKMGTDAVHSVDPQANAAIEGAQMPGWGGYDYSRLSFALDLMEPYDIGDNIEIIRSLNPNLKFVTTAFATGPWEKHRVWYELLHGARGHIIWDPDNSVVDASGALGPRGRDVAPYWNEIREGIGALLINSARVTDPVAIHYSQPSMRIEWMREQRPKGDAWMNRQSSTERSDSEFLRVRDSWCRLLEDEGLQYKFVSYQGVENGELARGGYRVLVLPRSTALSAAEARAIREFVDQGGIVVAEGEPGTFDEHDRRLAQSSLAGVPLRQVNALGYDHDRLSGGGGALRESVAKVLEQANVHPTFHVLDAAGKAASAVKVHEFRNGGVTIVGLINNPPIEQDELGPLKAQAIAHFDKAQNVRLIAPESFYAYDVRRGKPLGKVKQIPLTVDPYEPVVIAFSPTPLPELRITAPDSIRAGETAALSLSVNGSSAAALDVFHVELRNPAGDLVRYLSGNVLAPNASASYALPLATNDAPGKWTVEARDVLSGRVVKTTVTVLEHLVNE